MHINFQEYESKIVPWLVTFAVFTIFRTLAFVFFSVVNDMIFAYNIMMCLIWTLCTVVSVYGWVVVYSLYVELSDLTKLEDLAHLRVSVCQLLLVCSYYFMFVVTVYVRYDVILFVECLAKMTER